MIGTKLYKYITMRGVGLYEVVGQDGDFIMAKATFCGGRSQSCIVRLVRVEGYKTRWRYVNMLQVCGQDTYENSDGDQVSNEHMWHNDSLFFERKADCKKHKGQDIISGYDREIEKLKEEVKRLESRIASKEMAKTDMKTWMEEKPSEDHKENS